MNALESTGGVNSCAIDDDISNLSHEDIGRNPAGLPSIWIGRLVGAGVNQCKRVEISSSLEDWSRSRIAYELCHVVEDYGLANEVGAAGDVDLFIFLASEN